MKKLLLISLILILVFSFACVVWAVDLTVWSGGYYGEPSGWYFDKVIAEFREIYPEVNIEVEQIPHVKGIDKIAIGIATGTTADIILAGASSLTSYALQGVISDFSDTMTQEENADYLPGYVDTFGIDGQMQQYLVTGIYGAGGMGINKMLVEKAGAMDLLPLDRPYRHWTIDEYKVFIQKMTEYIKENNLTDTYTTAWNFGDSTCNQVIIMWFFQDGWGIDPLEVVDGRYKCVLNSPKAIEALQWYLDLYNDPTCGIMPGAENIMIDWYENYWFTGKLVSCYGEGAGCIKWEQSKPEIRKVLETTIVPYPNGPGGSPTIGINGVGISAFKTGDLEKEKYSKLFCQFFATRPDMAEVTGSHCPPTYSSYNPDSPLYQKPLWDDIPEAVADFERTTADPTIRLIDFGQKCPVYKQYLTTFSQTMQGVFIGELTVKEGLDIFVEKVNILLDEYYEENPVE